jgi:raffinose/stachyose/melibiose transport system permease protein
MRDDRNDTAPTNTVAPRRPRRSGAWLRIRRTASAIALVAVTVMMLIPVLLMVSASLRTDYESGTDPLGLPLHPQWQNYESVFTSMDYPRSLANTLAITACSVALVVMTGSMCAYAISRYVQTWTRLAYRLFVAGLTVPIFVVLTPLYILIRDLGLLDSYLSVILVYAALNLPLAVFFYTSFLRAIPLELEDAAAVDGCGPWMTFWRIVFPLMRPGTATLGILVALNVWNDLVVPLVFLSSEDKQTLTLSVYGFLGTERYLPSQLFPAVVLAIAPLFLAFLLLQRRIVAGITAGVGKG